MASPANAIVRPPPPPVPPSNLRSSKNLSINLYTDPTGEDIMTTEEISAVINSQMARFSAQPITPFDGTSYPASEWLINFDSYMAVTGRKSDEERKHSLTTLLTGDAKVWLRLQPKETRASYKLIRKGQQNRFSPSEDELFNRKTGPLRHPPGTRVALCPISASPPRDSPRHRRRPGRARQDSDCRGSASPEAASRGLHSYNY